MSPSQLNSILWIPFAAVAVIAGLIFVLSGYKRGFFRSLISLAATVVSAVLSVVAARMLSSSLSETVMGLIPPIEGAEMFQEVIDNLVLGVVNMLVTLLVFSVLFFVLTIVIKAVSRLITFGKSRKVTSKLAGMAIRLVDAALYAILLLVPIYGTLCSFMPTVQSFMPTLQSVSQMNETEIAELQAYMDTAAEHPVISLYQAGPGRWVYDILSGAESSEGTGNILEMANTLEGFASRMEAVLNKTGADRTDAAKDLVSFAQNNLVESDWFYDLVVKGVLSGAEDMLKGQLPAEQQGIIDAFSGLFEMNKEDFQKGSKEVLNLTSGMLENGIMEIGQNNKFTEYVKSDDFRGDVETVLKGETVSTMMEGLVDGAGEDPFGLSQNLSEEQKKNVRDSLENIYKENAVDPDNLTDVAGDFTGTTKEEAQAYNEEMKEKMETLLRFIGA